VSSIYSRVDIVKLSGFMHVIFEIWSFLIFLAAFGLTIEIAVNHFSSFNAKIVIHSSKLLCKVKKKCLKRTRTLLVNVSDAIYRSLTCFRKKLNKTGLKVISGLVLFKCVILERF